MATPLTNRRYDRTGTWSSDQVVVLIAHRDRHDVEIVYALRVRRIDGTYYVCGGDLTIALGYSTRATQLSNFERDLRKEFTSQTIYCSFGGVRFDDPSHPNARAAKLACAINNKGIALAFNMALGTMPNAKARVDACRAALAKAFRMEESAFVVDSTDVHVRIQRVALNEFEAIQACTSWAISELEFKCDRYSIDLYFPNERVAVECDEHDHGAYVNDDERQLAIEERLDCVFFRFNPDDPDFNLHVFIGRLGCLLLRRRRRLMKSP